MEKEIKILKKEKEFLSSKNTNLVSDNESLLDEQKKTNKLILSHKETIERLNKEISSLKEITLKYTKEIEELKDRINNKENINNNDAFEDEIVIVNKETTYSKGYGHNWNKKDEYKNRYEIKKKFDLNDSEMIKYHDIIQEMSNMILIYENFFFKRDVKPKNNKELFCYLIVQYINKKILKVKLNAFLNLIIYKECISQKQKDKTNYLNDSDNDNENKDDSGFNYQYRKAYGSRKNRRKNDDDY